MDLETIWYGVLLIAILFYTVLDGFDLGVGILHLFVKKDEDRRIFLNSIGPVWDANEVWIVVVMGGLFAGFPGAYATIFSGFYSLLMILIAALIFRPVAIEFRSKRKGAVWRSCWDATFSLSSWVVALVIGLLVGNMVQGVPLDAQQDFMGIFAEFFRPYPICMALLSVSLFSMHGAVFLSMKTEGEVQTKVLGWLPKLIFLFLGVYLILTVATFRTVHYMVERIEEYPLFYVFPFWSLLATLLIFYQVKKERMGWAFLCSCASIFFLLSLLGLGMYPKLVVSSIDPDLYSLTIYNTASSKKTLEVLLTVVAIGIPIVLGYGVWIYRVFKGKVKIDSSSY